ncbi:DJ-1/PfpI family protein [Maridesulfovibrio frigidus]|uniref:DJ-1/PfpI family protein n=1 Tax=Maridesulfovibrio frigidus TaxID=340956 RepID=UPI0004E28C1B|nr:DJ-1/PfpI family protein [Maridesulfovibrio frigidus]
MTKVAVILTQGFADWEYALIAGTGGPYYGLDVQFFTPEVGEVRSFGGLVAVVNQGFELIAEWAPTVVVVVGGNIWMSSEAPDISELLKSYHSNGGTVAGICGGTLAIARAGLLNDVLHTSNDADFLSQNAKGYSGTDSFRKSCSAVSDKGVITAPPTAPVSFTAAILESAGINEETVLQFRNMMAAEHA